MTYKNFKTKGNILNKLFVRLGILTTNKIIIRINNTPDYDISEYKREEDSNYYFHNSWGFSGHAQFIADIDVIDSKIFHYDDLLRASQEYNLLFDHENHVTFINEMYALNNDWFSQDGIEPDIDQFKLSQLRVASIDNEQRQFHYEGSFFGNYETFDPIDWGLYSLIEITGMPQQRDDFYKEIIAESYILNREKKNKLSYFLAYSAFESFINKQLGGEDEEKRIKEKVTDLYKNKFANIDTHQIYCSVMNAFTPFSNNRNNIAHGRNNISIGNEELNDALMFIAIMICTYELGCNTFDELYELI